MHMATLLPIAPILLLPFIIAFFILVFPLWMVAMLILSILFGLAKGVDALLAAMKIRFRISKPVSEVFHWTLSWGGIADRRDRPKPK